MKCSIRSLYLCVKDMERAIRFYEDFFEQKVVVRRGIESESKKSYKISLR